MVSCRHVWHFCLVAFFVLPLIVAKDFYELLGISRDANDREIRKAFKKLALQLHPDKNTDDPTANENFIKINRAYEVLKDEEKRKKYDLYGEEGLKDDFKFAKSGFKSWNYYYENFGIYDDDPEIITLNKADFDQSVTGTADMWFINFYSPSCSHCHQLAPAWREMARDLDGVIRIGAVNCEEDWVLCRQQGIQSYPSLMVYPNGEKYRGERTTRHLVKYILQQLDTRVIDLWEGNFYKYLTDDGVPWLIVFCQDDGDCPSSETVQKVAAMLDGLVNIGTVDCSEQKNLCMKLGHNSGIRYFTSFDKDHKAQEISTNDAKEITKSVLEFLPKMITLSEKEFQGEYRKLQQGDGEPWLIEFTKEDQPEDLQLRKLPALLSGINVGRIDCTRAAVTCTTFFVRKYPMFILFKQNGGHEIHHGRQNAYDIASFARESVSSNVQVLGPHDFPHRVINGESTWFIDFYAPWCPPCMQLLPEWRKASRSLGQSISFGTVDCTIHQSLCNNYNIRSYPTSILYNQSHPHQYYGPASAPALIEFVQDVLSPPVVGLNVRSFELSVANRPQDELWVIDFYAPWCQPCQQLSSQWRKLAKMFSKQASVHIAQVDCTVEAVLCDNQNVRSYPTIRLYPPNSVGASRFHTFNDWNRDAVSLRSWIHQFLPSKVTTLDPSKFDREVLGGDKPWTVDFYAPWCGHCQVFAPEFESVAEALDKKINFGKLNCESYPEACHKAGIRAYPTVKFYRGNDRLGEVIDSQESESLIKTLMKKVSLSSSPPPRTIKETDSHDEL